MLDLVKTILMTHLLVQASEVEELNGGKVLYSSTDQDGDFRVGDAFSVDQETGNVPVPSNIDRNSVKQTSH